MVEGARLESVYTLITYRGFESLSHRHLTEAPPQNSNRPLKQCATLPKREGSEPEKGFDKLQRNLQRARSAKPAGLKQPKGCFN